MSIDQATMKRFLLSYLLYYIPKMLMSQWGSMRIQMMLLMLSHRLLVIKKKRRVMRMNQTKLILIYLFLLSSLLLRRHKSNPVWMKMMKKPQKTKGAPSPSLRSKMLSSPLLMLTGHCCLTYRVRVQTSVLYLLCLQMLLMLMVAA